MKIFSPILTGRDSHYGNNFWTSFSAKLHRIVHFFSDLEYKNWLTVEIDPDIVEFCEQPLEINISIDGKLEKSIFDMWVKKADGTEELWEIKYEKELYGNDDASIRSQKQIRKQREWCQTNSFIYKVRTEKDIELGIEYINNLRYLVHLIKRLKDTPPLNHEGIRRKIAIKERMKISELTNETCTLDEVMKVIAYLINNGSIKADISDKAIDTSTEVFINYGC